MKIALLTNIPTPYRVLVFNLLHQIGACHEICIFYCAKIEPNRKWTLPDIHHNHIFLETIRIKNSIYLKSNIYNELKKLHPDVIIVAGFNPVSLKARFYALVNNIKIIEYTDTWLISISHLSLFHKLLRKILLKKIDAAVCASEKGIEYLLKFGVPRSMIFKSPLVIDNSKYLSITNNSRNFHVIFSGQFINIKMPLFFVEICIKLKSLIDNFRVLIIGDGPMKKEILQILSDNGVNFYYPGFIQQIDLPKYYTDCKILLFPTQHDSWGLVANEACASGCPVITCKNAGVSGELIINDFTGYILDLDVNLWVAKICELLNNNDELTRLSGNCYSHIKNYTVEKAVKGFIDALEYVNIHRSI